MVRLVCLLAMLALSFGIKPVMGASMDDIQDTYKKVADGLLDVCKQYGDARPKIYSVLDQVNKLCSTAKNLAQDQQSMAKNLQDKTNENQALKKELASLRSDISTARKSLDTAKIELNKKLEEHKTQAQQLVEERKDLMNKITTLEANQTKEPSDTKKTLAKRQSAGPVTTGSKGIATA